MRFSPGAALLLVCALCVNASATIIRYVDIDYANDSSDNENGLSWETEFNTIQEGVDAASTAGGGEVWVAEGTYTGTSANVVVMKSNVHIYGGFVGNESTRAERNWTQHPTIIDGQDDGENGRRGVFCSDVNNATLDGFTITHGYAYNGSAMYNFNSSPKVTNCTFSYNTAGGDSGGGIYNNHSSPKLTNCVFLHNTAVRDDTRDSDGDGYTDAEEYAYLCLYYLDPLYDPSTNPPSYPHYDAVTNDGQFPGSNWPDSIVFPGHDWAACIPTVQINIVVKGEGTVFPAAGAYTLAQYPMDCGFICSATPPTTPCTAFNSVTLTAHPAVGWELRRWYGDMADVQGLSGSVEMSQGRYVVAEFCPSVGDLDLVSDLAALLAALGVPETVDTFDRNAIAYDENAERVYVANGIPDAAELYLIQRVLLDINYDRSSQSGAVHDTVWAAWDKNLRQAQEDFAGMDMAVIRAVAGYMTLGDFGSVAMLTALFDEYASLPASFDPSAYDRSQQRHFNSNESVANNGVSNLDHWRLASPNGSLNNLVPFGKQASGDALVIVPPPAGQPACPNDACRPHGPLTIYPASPKGAATVTAWREDGTTISTDEDPVTLDVYYGEEITVEAIPTDEDYVLSSWLAPYTQINESRDPERQTFVHTFAYTFVKPFFARGQIDIPLYLETSLRVITTTPESEVVTEEDDDGNPVDHRYIFGKPWASASLSAEIVDSPQNENWYIDGWDAGRHTGFGYWSSSLAGGVSMLLCGGNDADPSVIYHYPIPPYKPPKKASYWGMAGAGGVVLVGGGYAAYFLGSAEWHAKNSSVNFSAVAKPGYQFDGWDEYPGQPSYFTLPYLTQIRT